MIDKKISPDRWQALYGAVTQDFNLMVQQTLKKTREAPVMKRFTLRTALILLICLLLLTGIALAATSMFGTRDSLNNYTSAPTGGIEVNIQTSLKQTSGDFPDLTVKVRDAAFDGVTAFVTVEYRLKHPERDMILSDWDTQGFGIKEVGRWPGYSMVPLTNPETDPRRKLVIAADGALVYGLYNHAIAEHIYESDGVLVLIWRIRVDSDRLFDAGYTWETRSGVYDSNKAAYYQETVDNIFRKIASNEPLELTLITECQEWDGDVKTPGKKLYFSNTGIALDKGPAPVIRYSQALVTQGEMTLTSANVTFTNLATYMDIRRKYPMQYGTESSANQLAYGLAFDWLDKDGNVIPELGGSMSGLYDWETVGDTEYEINQYSAFWPAVEQIPDIITLQARRLDTGECLGTFAIPLAPEPSPAPTSIPTDEPQGTLNIPFVPAVPSPSPAP